MKNRAPGRRLRLAGHLLAVLQLSLVLLAPGVRAGSMEDNPLKPIDTSSPRATLTGFREFLTAGYESGLGNIDDYLRSGDLFFRPGTTEGFNTYLHGLISAERTLDLSELPPAMAQESARRLTIQLKEVLDRIELPPPDQIPDAKAMAESGETRWTIPDSAIRIYKVEKGPRAGEYLFDPMTVERLPEFYGRVKDLPYRPGSTPGWFDFYSGQPIAVAMALRHLVPPRWLLELPAWTRQTVLDQPLWRWLGIAVVAGAGWALVSTCFRLTRDQGRGRWRHLARPLSLVVVAPAMAFIFSELLRVSSPVYEWSALSLNAVFFLALTWAVWDLGGVLAESVIASERLRAGSIDSQLIRLVLRLVTVIAAVFILVAGADQLGIPAYSVVAGLGVGGLAVALAAQQTLANLLGSLIIMFEKPFAVGHQIKVGDLEGTVEGVGFRSTRIRTGYDSLVTIPSSDLVNKTIDNLELRQYRRVRTNLGLAYETPRERIEAFAEDVRNYLIGHPAVRRDPIRVFFHDFGASSLDILLYFFVRAPNLTEELRLRHEILLEVMDLAAARGVSFAFPTQSVHIENWPGTLRMEPFDAGPPART